jgi:ATP-dependent Clp protease ATP-binding subunit ClpC
MTFRLGYVLPLALYLLSHENAHQWSALTPSKSSPLFADAFSMTSSFMGHSHKQITRKIASHSNEKSNNNKSFQLSMVVDRLSEECIAATQVSQKVGNEVGLRLLKNEALIVGIVNRPEKSGRTLARYNLVYPLVRKSAEKVLEQNGFQLKPKVNRDTLLTNEKPLSFSEDVKMSLTTASQIADHFDSRMIHSEHVLLALMGYNFGKPIDQMNVGVGLEIFRNTENVVDPKFSAYDFCEDLLQDMKLPYDFARNTVTDEVVVIGGGSTKSNTLEEVGVDLTQLAVEGKLDRVYGRDNEIMMALRTLGRRRKNNPCLIGDPGVGKVRRIHFI